MKILHLASFTGNIGDQLNHLGFRKWFEKFFEKKIVWTELEIRDFYRGIRHFDSKFVDECNQHDLVVVGGGNYFELWPQNSRNGTSIDLTIEMLDEIKVPIFFNALGVDLAQGISEVAKIKFPEFLNVIASSNDCLVSVRNDGAKQNLLKLGLLSSNIYEIPDHGFFGLDKSKKPVVKSNTVAINLAEDMGRVRFDQFRSEDEFFQEFAEVIVAIHEKYGFSFRFISHVQSDVSAHIKICKKLPDKLIREKIEFSKLNTSNNNTNTFREYDDCEFVLANRFHSNVYCVSNQIPFLGLINYPQIQFMLENLGLENLGFDVSRPGFKDSLLNKLDWALNSEMEIKSKLEKVWKHLIVSRNVFEETLRMWISENER